MPADKNQHYVPRFYIKYFAKGNKKSIGLKNLNSGLVVEKANIKNQCSKDYFYTNDGRNEKPFADAEGKYNTTIKAIIDTGKLPQLGTDEFKILLSFISFQRARTAGALAEYHSVANQVTREVLRTHFTLKGDEEMLAYVDRVSWTTEGLAMQLIKDALIASPILHDLSGILIRNVGKEKFIISDDPIVHTNKFSFSQGGKPNTGISCRGLIIIFPISSETTVMLFDAAVYKLNVKYLRNDGAFVIGDSEVKHLNRFQYLHALENIYFGDKNEVAATLTQSRIRRGGSIRSSAKVATEHNQTQTGGVLAIKSQQASPRWPNELLLLSIRKSAKRGQFGVGDMAVRNPEFTRYVRNLLGDSERFKRLISTVA